MATLDMDASQLKDQMSEGKRTSLSLYATPGEAYEIGTSESQCSIWSTCARRPETRAKGLRRL